MFRPNTRYGLSLYVEVTKSDVQCVVYALNEYTVLIVHTLHTEYLISELATDEDIPYWMCGQKYKFYNFVLYIVLIVFQP
jgi:hypothetical protein